ncbi:MAG: helix-hairpin-helix domain-containing protein [Ferruginibacter sp.]|nr:helix-hairpin-helix domain-containing protein [Ferruginibacter sp.]
MWKDFISGYLSFTKKDRTGILVLISLVVFFAILPYFYPYFIKQKTYDPGDFKSAIASLQVKRADSTAWYEKRHINNRNNQDQYSPSTKDYTSPPLKGELFYFDPNSASPADWKKLGVRDKTIATIRNYLSKGGKFYKKEDIGKIWGLHKDEVERLLPYIQIHTSNSTNNPAEKPYEKSEYKKISYTNEIVDINIADTAAFIALPGIGSKLSQRIVLFRDKLGGFYRVEQIGETFGLPDSVFQKIKSRLKIGSPQLRRININTATVDEMKSHPYLRYVLANAISQYRIQHGNFEVVNDIKKIMTITEDIFNKLAPYLTVN